ncbi:Histidine phosphatase superfamily (branch 1) [Trypanosoma brucei equiperdum]|uniref:Histidine phosphatase superfamily (Branch 1) n=1 Tax=Trypanosoma brucei equiperdum TaxID=630700 RepID=A0A3L6L4B8_9TRYP|nr:Histidine phosphatase superfamily (branch 1) [Trypanosoma brucei equiperdum]
MYADEEESRFTGNIHTMPSMTANGKNKESATETTDLLRDGGSKDDENVGYTSAFTQTIVVMRHGERRDGSVDAEPEADPPLTEQGLANVSNAATELRNILGSRTTQNLQILTSPFLRTMQTAERLQKCGIGVRRQRIVDNNLCEVYGPLRIKSKEPPRLPDDVVVSGRGSLPLWGESLESATKRFADALQMNSRTYSEANLLFVTHGDALGAIVSALYPMRMVYEAEYLSFIVLRKNKIENSLASGCREFELVASKGVQWMITGPEDCDPQESGHAASEDSALGKKSDPFGQPRGDSPLHISRRPFGAEDGASPINSHNLSNEEGRGCLLDFWLLFVFRVLAVASQAPLFFFLETNLKDAGTYITVVLLLELIFFYASTTDERYFGFYQALVAVENFPAVCRRSYRSLSGGHGASTPRPNVLLVLCAASLKCFAIFAIASGAAAFLSLFPGIHFTMFDSYKMIFNSFWSALLVLFLLLFNFVRVYCYVSVALAS